MTNPKLGSSIRIQDPTGTMNSFPAMLLGWQVSFPSLVDSTLGVLLADDNVIRCGWVTCPSLMARDLLFRLS